MKEPGLCRQQNIAHLPSTPAGPKPPGDFGVFSAQERFPKSLHLILHDSHLCWFAFGPDLGALGALCALGALGNVDNIRRGSPEAHSCDSARHVLKELANRAVIRKLVSSQDEEEEFVISDPHDRQFFKDHDSSPPS
eukprot:763056-Hanusia_phi.AAC.8